MGMEIVRPSSLARPSGFSHGIKVQGGRTLYLAGQVGQDSEGKVVGPGDIQQQFDKALENLKAVLTEAGGRPEDLVKMNIFVTDVAAYYADPKQIGQSYVKHLGRHYPAMTLVEVKGLYRPEFMIEIEAIAVLPDSP